LGEELTVNSKLADWSDDEIPQTVVNKKYETVVILKHMFSLSELDEDPEALQDITADIREECEKLGEVANITVYDREKEGVVSVKFEEKEAAEACVRLMDGRMFAGERVEAYIFDGSERFRKKRKDVGVDKDAEEEARLEAFGDWLEEGAPENQEPAEN
jgi:HIV Tat-specific factor 1